MKIKAIVAGMMLSLAAVPAAAQMPEIYLGLHGGKTFGSGDLSSPGGFSLEGLSAEGYAGGVHGGMDVKIPSSNLFLGGFGDFTWQDTAFNITAPGFNFEAGLGDSWAIGARAGMYFGEAKVYVATAYRSTKFSVTANGTSVDSRDLTGYDLRVGAAMPVARNVDLGVEGIWTIYEDVNYGNGALKLEPEALGIQARLTFNLGGPDQLVPKSQVAAPEPAPARRPCDPKMANC